MRASRMSLTRVKELSVDRIEATLYGNLAATGKGYMTDQAILSVLNPVYPTTMFWEPRVELTLHSNGMRFVTFDKEGKELKELEIYSIGGGTFANESFNEQVTTSVYELSMMADTIEYLDQRGFLYWEYVESCGGPDTWDHLAKVREAMRQNVHEGLTAEGVLPDSLHLCRKIVGTLAKSLSYKDSVKTRGMVYSYALAVSEQNAAGGRTVTALTCGSCGVIPVVLLYLQGIHSFRDERILRALAMAGPFVNVMRTSASISGTEIGCQGEVGVACVITIAVASQLFDETLCQVEYAAKVGLECHLGLTCDPVCGLVQIPCVEHSASTTSRALGASTYTNFTDGRRRMDFDQVVVAMYQTGKDLPSLYRKTAEGELALLHEKYGNKILTED